MKDELAVDMTDMAAAAKEALGQADVDQQIEVAETPEALRETVEVDNGEFWGEAVEAPAQEEVDAADEAVDESTEELIDEDDLVPQESEASDEPGILTYKANGKDVQIDLTDPATLDALKQNLSFIDGARKAFSDKNKLRQEAKKLQSQMDELRGFKDSWEKLEDMRGNPEQLYEVLTGEKFTDMVQRKVDQKSIYNEASEEDRKIMDYEERIARMERDNKRASEQRQKELAEAQSVRRDAAKRELKSRMEQEFNKYDIFGEDPNSNRARKMLWQSAIYDLQEQGQDNPSEESIIAAFKDNANALQVARKAGSTKKTEAARKAKKAKAKKAAGKAAQATNKAATPDELVGLDPLSLFNWGRGRRNK
jgi:hypothetical protein